MQHQIREQRRDRRALRGSACSLLQGPVFSLHGSTQPPFYIETHPARFRMVGYCLFDQVPWNRVEERPYIQVDDPVEFPAAFTRSPHRIERRTAGPIAVGIGVEDWLHYRFQNHLGDRLGHAVGDSADAQRAYPTIRLGDFHEADWRWKVCPRRHPIPDLVEISLQVLLECFDRHAIHTLRSVVRFHSFPSVPNEVFGNIVRLCYRHRLLPFLVDLRPWQEDRIPSLHPRYRASSLLRTRPPLHHASVLCPQRVFRLRGLPLASWRRFPRSTQEPAVGIAPSKHRLPLG